MLGKELIPGVAPQPPGAGLAGGPVNDNRVSSSNTLLGSVGGRLWPSRYLSIRYSAIQNSLNESMLSLS
ncbi:hypothetical protein HanHA300_Chr14g0507451 [Helianthus annuus]|nr:hypothetical protein HanHA300_Chr14g0507451 [Helianthus annuus]KAJ0484067.1 hypothetical protein HanHA89_Chr14g0540001 [Helianthus annuus]